MGGRGIAAEIGVREIVLVTHTMHAMIFQAIHVLVCFVATEVLAFIWLVDDDGVLGGDNARGVDADMWSLVANSLGLRSLVDGKLSPILRRPFFGGMDVEIVERKGDGGGRKRLVRGLDRR